MKSARQKDEEAKLRAAVQNAPGWHRKAQPDDCDGCEKKREEQARKQAESKAKKATEEVNANDPSSELE